MASEGRVASRVCAVVDDDRLDVYAGAITEAEADLDEGEVVLDVAEGMVGDDLGLLLVTSLVAAFYVSDGGLVFMWDRDDLVGAEPIERAGRGDVRVRSRIDGSVVVRAVGSVDDAERHAAAIDRLARNVLGPVVADDGTATCPYCAETIKPEAKLCPHCRSALSADLVPPKTAVPSRVNLYTIASLVCGIVWLSGVGSILAITFGMMARAQIKDSGGSQTGDGLAVAGIVLGLIGILAPLLLVLVLLLARSA